MAKIKSLVMALVLVMSMHYPAIANKETLGMHGEIKTGFEMYKNPSEAWTIDLHYKFTNWLTIGTRQTTLTRGFYQIGFVPVNQMYCNYLIFDLSEYISLKLNQWCNHVVVKGFENTNPIISPESIGLIGSGLYIEMGYKF